MFQNLIRPRRSILDHSMAFVAALALVFTLVSVCAFALATRAPSRAVPPASIVQQVAGSVATLDARAPAPCPAGD